MWLLTQEQIVSNKLQVHNNRTQYVILFVLFSAGMLCVKALFRIEIPVITVIHGTAF
jgi:hypothetical protein